MRTLKHRLLRVGAKRAVCRVCMSLFEAFLFSEKSFSHFGGCLRRLCTRACPFLGHPRFRKKAFRIFGTVFGGFAARACPFLGHSCFWKNMIDDWQRVSKLHVFNPTRTPIRRRCRQNFPMMDGTCHLRHLRHLFDFSAIGRCRAPR